MIELENYEVKNMEDQELQQEEIQQEQTYEPRPRWQVWLARIGLAVFVLFLLMYYVNILRGGA